MQRKSSGRLAGLQLRTSSLVGPGEEVESFYRCVRQVLQERSSGVVIIDFSKSPHNREIRDNLHRIVRDILNAPLHFSITYHWSLACIDGHGRCFWPLGGQNFGRGQGRLFRMSAGVRLSRRSDGVLRIY